MTWCSVALFDLDGTLIDSRALSELRQRRKWREAARRVAESYLYDGVRLMLDSISSSARYGIVTTSVSYYAEAVCRFHHLSPRAMVCFHDAPPKPSPAATTELLSRLSVSRGDRVVGVGDSEVDRVSFSKAGVLAIGAGWSAELDRAAGWDIVLETPEEVAGVMRYGPV